MSIKSANAVKAKQIAPGKKKKYDTMASETGILFSEKIPNFRNPEEVSEEVSKLASSNGV
jgi:hypothetical protein